MQFHVCYAWLVLPVLLTPSPVWADQKVGDLAAPAHLTIQGTVTFPVGTVESRLRQDPSVQITGRPAASLAAYLEVLQRQTLRGYLAAGFADAKVDVHIDKAASMIEMAIEEGTRYVAGNVQVTGVPSELCQQIVAELSDPSVERGFDRRDDKRNEDRCFELSDFDDSQHDLQSPWWVEGEPVPFHDTAMQRLRDRISSILRDCGRDRARFDISWRCSDGRADLVIRVDDLGPAMFIRGVHVVGNDKNSEQEIIESADVQPGTLLTATEYRRIGRRLWQSARFLTQKVEVEPLADGVNLMIIVREYPPAPRLLEPLSREEETLLKLREWFVSGDGSNEDLVFELFSARSNTRSLTTVLSLHSGVIILTDPRDSRTDGGWNFGLLLHDRRVSLCSKDSRSRLDFDIGNFHIKSRLTVATTNKSDHEFNGVTSLGLSIFPASRGDTRPPMTTTLRFEPTSFLAMAHRDGASIEWDKDVLTLRTPTSRTKIDSQSGRLIEWIKFSRDENSPDVRLTTSRGEFERLLTNYEQEVADCHQVHRPHQPVSSAATLVLSDLPHDPDFAGFDLATYLLRQERRDVLRKLIDRGALQLIDELTNVATTSLDRGFYIPRQAQFASLQFWQGGVGIADTWFPYGSWPWHVWRGVFLLLSGANDQVTDLYYEMYVSDDGGPLAWCVISHLFGLFSPEHAVDAAARGLKAVDGKAFLADCDPLLDARYVVGRNIRSLVSSVAELSESETFALGQLLTEAGVVTDPQVISHFMAAYRQNVKSDDPLRETLLQYWENGLNSRLVEDMRFRKQRKAHIGEARTESLPTRDAPAIKGWEASRLLNPPEATTSGK